MGKGERCQLRMGKKGRGCGRKVTEIKANEDPIVNEDGGALACEKMGVLWGGVRIKEVYGVVESVSLIVVLVYHCHAMAVPLFA